MKTLLLSLFIWIFIVPVAVAVFLIFTVLAALAPGWYFVCIWLALVFSALLIVLGPFPFLFEKSFIPGEKL